MGRVLTIPRAVMLLVPVVIGGVLVTLVATAGRPDPTTQIEVSGPMAKIDRPSMNDMGRVDPSLYEGKAVLVNFWASWCGPCRKEQPALSRLWEEYRGRGAQFIGVNFMDDRAAGGAYLEEFQVSYPSVEDRTGVIAHRFGVPYLPATVIVGADGELRVRLVGEQTEASFRRHLDEALADPGIGVERGVHG